MAILQRDQLTTDQQEDLDRLRGRWLGRTLHGSSDPMLPNTPAHFHAITDVWVNDPGEWVAYAGEHLRASSPEALERRLHSLTPRAVTA